MFTRKKSKEASSPLDTITSESSSVGLLEKGYGSVGKNLNIAIIGGGVSGLTTARIFKAQGLNFTLYEATDSVSGVWSTGYPNFAIQTPGKLYEFPDKELMAPKDYKDGLMIKKYCEDYVEDHDLSPSIELNIKVTSIERVGNNKWMLELKKGGETRMKKFDYVVLATGIYSPNLKHIPNVKDLNFFKGNVYHSEETANIQDRQGKKTLVIGFGKSAQDCAMNALTETGVQPTLLFRSAHWCVPRKILGLIPMEWLLYSRFGQGTLPRWQTCGPVEWFFHTVLWPLIWVYWRVVELILILQLGLWGSSSHLRPTLAIEDDMYCGHGVICHPEIFPLIHKGDIEAVQGEIDCILSSGEISLQDGSIIEADEIVFATGFKRDFAFLPKELLEKKDEDGFYTYRNMIVPGVPNIAFLNSNATTFSNITTPTLQAAWLAELLLGNIDLPLNMEDLVRKEKLWRRKKLTYAGDARAYLIQLHQIRYWDSLLNDIGAVAKRKKSGMGPVMDMFMNFFVPVYSSDYKTITTGEWKKSNVEKTQKGVETSFLAEWCILTGSIGAIAYLCAS